MGEQRIPRRSNRLCVRSQEGTVMVLGRGVYGDGQEGKVEMKEFVTERAVRDAKGRCS